MPRALHKILLASVLLMPSTLQVAFQLTNKGFPVADGGDHFRIAVQIYLAFTDNFLSGVQYVFHTGGKPILFSAFVAPLIFLNEYGPLVPVGFALVIITAVTTWGYYWLFTTQTTVLVSALLASVITTVPVLFSISTQFMPETIWHMWFVLFLATLYRSRHLTNTKLALTSGTFLSLTILARPVESIILISPPLLLYFYYLTKISNNLSIKKVLLIVSLSIFPIAISGLCNYGVLSPLVGITIITILAAFLIIYARKNKSQGEIGPMEPGEKVSYSSPIIPALHKFLLPISILLSVWLFFYASQIVEWAYDNSFGVGAAINDQVSSSKNTFEIFIDVISAYGKSTITILFSLAVISLYVAYKKKIGISRKQIYFLVFSIILAVLPMIIAYSVTGTSDLRRISLGIIYFIIVMCFLGFRVSDLPRTLGRTWVFVATILLGTQVVSITSFITNYPSLVNIHHYLTDKIGFTLQYVAPNRQKSMDEDVIRKILSAGVTEARIAVFSLGMFSKKILFQTESLRYVTLGIDKSLSFHTMWAYADYEPYDKVIDRLRSNKFDYVLLEGLDNPIADPAYKERMRSHTFFVHEALQIMKDKGEKGLPDLLLVKKFGLDDRYVYLYKIQYPVSPKITASSQFREFGPEGLFSILQPGWHSEESPKYPQRLNVDLIELREFRVLGMLPQTGHAARGPKHVIVKVSRDGDLWITAGSDNQICNPNAAGGWHNLEFQERVKARFMEIEIHSNCGDPNYLTLMGLSIS